jgi:Ca-activated chloride channel family protein
LHDGALGAVATLLQRGCHVRRLFVLPIVIAVAGLLTHCDSDDELAVGEPLRLGEAPSALCGGAGDREGKQEGPSSGSGTSGSSSGGDATGAGGGGTTGPGGSTGAGGMGGSGAGGSGGGNSGGSGGTSNLLGSAPGASPLAAEGGACAPLDQSTPFKVYLSSDDSNSMASPVIVRSLIEGGATSIQPWVIRTYEFLNYYRFSFPAAPAGELALVSQLGSCLASAGDVALQIAVQSEATPAQRRPMTLTLVLDTSGSMQGEPIALERAAVKAMASALVEGDIVNAVTWSVGQTPVLDGHVATGPDDPTVVAMADALDAGGGTDLSGGLSAGYALANQHKGSDRINRVVIISDGQANVGVTDEQIIGQNAEDQDAEGIYLVGVGVGEGVNDTMMDTVTDAGRGAYIFLDSEAEAQRMFVDRFNESILVAARDVRIELTLPWYFEIKQFFGEEYSPDPNKVRPQHLSPDDSMVLYQILRACDPTMPKASDPYKLHVTWKDPLTGEAKEALQETTLGALDIDDGNLRKAAAIVVYAEALKQLTVASPADRTALLQNAKDTVVAAHNGSDADLLEIAGLIDTLLSTTP